MKLLDFTIVKLTPCLIVGILLGFYFTIPLDISLVISTFLISLLFIVYVASRHTFRQTIWFGLLAGFTMISIGILTVNVHDQKLFDNHYSNAYDLGSKNIATLHLTVTEILKPNIYSNRYVADITKIDTTKTIGKILLNVSKDSTENHFHIDDQLLIKTSLQKVRPSLNPNQFDYKAYLKRQNIYAQAYTDSPSAFIVSRKKHSIYGYADTVRQTITTKLQAYNFKPDELAVIHALLLGQRQDIAKSLYEDYAKAGAIHILAISGLHIGIILFLLEFLLKPITRFKHGYLIRTILLIVLLWSFAVIAGLSASVVRAVTMFCAIAIGRSLKRPQNTYNTLAISAFVLLLFKPMFLFEVGFQMSYLAVIGIVAIQPLLFKPLKTNYRLPNKILMYTTVSLAAQLGILPLSLFYFHQFPGLFLLTNIFIIPCLGFILGYGFVVILMALVTIPKNIFTDFYGTIIDWMNYFFKWIAHQEAFIFKDISMNWLLVITTYLIIISFVRFLKGSLYKNLATLLTTVFIFQIVMIYNSYESKTTHEFVIFNKSKQSLIGIKDGQTLYIASSTNHPEIKNNPINDYVIGHFIADIETDSLRSVYDLEGDKLLIIDSLGIYQVKSFIPDYILLRNSPKINLTRVIDSLHLKGIIADGSNYKSYVKRWKETCEKQKLPFHYTNEKGAYIFKKYAY